MFLTKTVGDFWHLSHLLASQYVIQRRLASEKSAQNSPNRWLAIFGITANGIKRKGTFRSLFFFKKQKQQTAMGVVLIGEIISQLA